MLPKVHKLAIIISVFFSAANIAAVGQTYNPDDRKLLDLLEVKEEKDAEAEDEQVHILSDFLTDHDDSDTITVKYVPLRLVEQSKLPSITFMPVVFDYLEYIDSVPFGDTSRIELHPDSIGDWIVEEQDRYQRFRDIKRKHMIDHPDRVKYNINTLPAPPKKYVATVDPSKSTITISEQELVKSKKNIEADRVGQDVRKKNWLHTLNASLQFSQAYVSPNWYQGGNNNVNAIGNAKWNVKLNDRFNKKIIAEATTQYKLAMASAPQDTIHSYLISEDLFQFNGTFGVKAINNWYYSVTGQFKTQLLNNYKTNTNTLKAAFMSPGELNLGVGMTYNHSKKNFTLDMSLAPLSYNMKISTNPRIDETSFGISEGRHTVSEVGSNAEVKMTWNIMWNITYTSRFFVFSDYKYIQGDWEHTVNFSINRYLSTQFYVHMRYDSSQDSYGGWHKWQMKEILSFGLQYQFTTI
jgi:hypothetical protein